MRVALTQATATGVHGEHGRAGQEAGGEAQARDDRGQEPRTERQRPPSRPTPPRRRRIPSSPRSSAPDGLLARVAARLPLSARSSSRWPSAVARAIARARTADRRGRHRHRQDLRLPRPGAALRRQGDRLHRHQDAAGPALPARPAAGARRAAACRRRSRCSRAARTTSATTISSAPRRKAGCLRARTRATCRRSSRSRAPRDTGDRGALADVPENASIWPLVTSTRDNCLGGNCAHHDDVLRAEGAQGRARSRRRRRQSPPVLRRRDAARRGARRAAAGLQHHHPRRGAPAARHRDAVLRRAAHRRAARRPRARRRGRRAHRRARGGRAPGRGRPASARPSGSCGWRSARSPASSRCASPPRARASSAALDALAAALDRLAAELELHAERSEDLGACARRASDAAAQLARWRGAAEPPAERDEADAEDALDPLGRRHGDRAGSCTRRRCRSPGSSGARSNPRAGRGSSPRRRWRSAATFRSTSASSGSPTPPPATGRARSTTRPRRCCTSRATCPRPIRASTPKRWSRRRCRCSRPAAAAPSCCSPRCARSNVARDLLADAFARDGLDWPLLVQGEGSRSELLTRFRELGNAVLLGSQSFWEGVDVAGDALSVVVIDKLPFAPPDDPLLAARLERLRAEGGNPFLDYQLPQAVISLKQGAGRLIRIRDRPRRADDLRPAAGRQALRQEDLAQPAADAAHARPGGGRGVLHRRVTRNGPTTALRRITRTSTMAWRRLLHPGALGERLLAGCASSRPRAAGGPASRSSSTSTSERVLVGGRARVVEQRGLRPVHRRDVGAAIVVVPGDLHLVHSRASW